MTQPLRSGDPRRLGEYELLGRLGQGGMGTVFLGRNGDGRPVAIKVVRTDFAADDEFLRRFRSEVNRLREVPPFSTAEVIGADTDHDPPYVVVEYVDGPSLETVIRDQGPLRGAALHSAAVGIATALTAIHGARVIHRDLKPANVLMAMGGVKVIDFGIARPLEATSRHTGTDQLVGTVAYMAPERFEPGDADQAGFPADIFAWGAVVAYAATAHTPFEASSAPAIALRIISQPPNLDGLEEPLRTIVARSLAKDPADRPTARELLDLLLATQSAPGTAPAVPRRRRLWPVAAALLALATGGGLYASHAHVGRASHAHAGRTDTAARPAPVVPSPSVSTAPVGLPAILDGHRRTLLHMANIDRDLALPQNAPAKAGGGTTPESLFVLVPSGENFRIKSAVTDLAGHDRCLGVNPDPRHSAGLSPTGCDSSDPTLFSLRPTGQTDEKNRPTYSMTNDPYGIVQWNENDREVYVEESGDFPAAIEFSFVDRGSI